MTDLKADAETFLYERRMMPENKCIDCDDPESACEKLCAGRKLGRYRLKVGKWGMYIHDILENRDIDMETVRDRLNEQDVQTVIDNKVIIAMRQLEEFDFSSKIIEARVHVLIKYIRATFRRRYDTAELVKVLESISADANKAINGHDAMCLLGVIQNTIDEALAPYRAAAQAGTPEK